MDRIVPFGQIYMAQIRY